MAVAVCGPSPSQRLSDWQRVGGRTAADCAGPAAFLPGERRLVNYVVRQQLMLNLKTVNVIQKHK